MYTDEPTKNNRIEGLLTELTNHTDVTNSIDASKIEENIKDKESLKVLENSFPKEEYVSAQNETPISEVTSDSIPQSESLSDIPSTELVENNDTDKNPSSQVQQNNFYEDKPPAYTAYSKDLLTQPQDQFKKQQNPNVMFFNTVSSDIETSKVNPSLHLKNPFDNSGDDYVKSIIQEEIPRLAYDMYQTDQTGFQLPETSSTGQIENHNAVNEPELDNSRSKDNVPGSDNTNANYEF